MCWPRHEDLACGAGQVPFSTFGVWVQWQASKPVALQKSKPMQVFARYKASNPVEVSHLTTLLQSPLPSTEGNPHAPPAIYSMVCTTNSHFHSAFKFLVFSIDTARGMQLLLPPQQAACHQQLAVKRLPLASP
jgi:hypothetical protein